jgi:hypothetical protein
VRSGVRPQGRPGADRPSSRRPNSVFVSSVKLLGNGVGAPVTGIALLFLTISISARPA